VDNSVENVYNRPDFRVILDDCYRIFTGFPPMLKRIFGMWTTNFIPVFDNHLAQIIRKSLCDFYLDIIFK